MRYDTAQRLIRIGAVGTAVSGLLAVTPLLTWLFGPTPVWLRALLALAVLGFMAVGAVGWDARNRIG